MKLYRRFCTRCGKPATYVWRWTYSNGNPAKTFYCSVHKPQEAEKMP